MAKPRFSVSADTRILERAAEHLRRFGAGRFSVVSIAEELGMSHANVYRFFSSKSDLLEAVIAQWLKPIETGLREIADSPDPARDKLERMLTGLHSAYREKLSCDPHLFAAFADSLRGGGAVARKHRKRIQAELRRVLDEGVASAAFAGEEQNQALALIFDATYRFIHPVCVALDAEIPQDRVAARLERTLEALLAALSSKK